MFHAAGQSANKPKHQLLLRSTGYQPTVPKRSKRTNATAIEDSTALRRDEGDEGRTRPGPPKTLGVSLATKTCQQVKEEEKVCHPPPPPSHLVSDQEEGWP